MARKDTSATTDVVIVRWPEKYDAVQLSPIEERLAGVLVEAGGGVVSEDELLRQGWPTGDPTANALRVHLHRLRRRLEYLGLEIRSVRSSGWILQPAADNDVSVAG